MRKLILAILPIADVLLVLFVYPAAFLLKLIRQAGVQRMPLCRAALMQVGVFPIRDHYYDPQFDNRSPKTPFSDERVLPALEMNTEGQLGVLGRLTFADELANTPREKTSELEFHFGNRSFESGDAEYWYQLIRSFKPRHIIEIGSGNSTLMAIKAIARNKAEDPSYTCEHVCIEPYEMPWLEESGVIVVREKVEDVDLAYFSRLQENDILFIDSSHIIRPQGDVLFEYLQLLPVLNKGVIVHIHDIFTPRNYPKEWLEGEVRLWNEQYLLEAFLEYNETWEVMGALNDLYHNHFDRLKAVAPFINADEEPASFYIRKVL